MNEQETTTAAPYELDPATGIPKGFGIALAEAKLSRSEPLILMRAFCEPEPGQVAMTMQQWAGLEKIRSPLLVGRLPETLGELERAAKVFGMSAASADDMSEAMVLGEVLLDAVRAAFATSMPMKEPADDKEPAKDHELLREPDGFGQWLPIFACLVTQCGLSEDVALRMRVDRALALIAGHRRNQGWKADGWTYPEWEVVREFEERARAARQAGKAPAAAATNEEATNG